MSPPFCGRPYRAPIVLLLAISAMAWPSVSEGRPYTVVSCNAGLGSALSAEAWTSSTTMAGSSYAACPTSGVATRGISDRITTPTSAGLTLSTHVFQAPAGTRITTLRWGGRLSRGNCDWGAMMHALPAKTVLFGVQAHSGCAVSGLDVGDATLPFAVPAGTTGLQQSIVCAATTCQPGAAFHTAATVVTIDDPTAPTVWATGPLVAGNWVRGSQQMQVLARDNTGIARTWTALGAGATSQALPCRYTNPRPCADRSALAVLSTRDIAPGPQPLTIGAQDAAGNIATARYVIRIDNDTPARVHPVLQAGEAWRRENRFTSSWQNPPQAYAPIARAWYRLCGPQGCSTGSLDGNAETLSEIAVGGSGEHALQVWLEDAAGNVSLAASGSDPVYLRLDQEAPLLAFAPQDQGDPLRVAVTAQDRLSGLDTGEIEMRLRGGAVWHALATARSGQSLVGYVDDERFGPGAYEFRAHARDRAGNEASTNRQANGALAIRDLPSRSATRLDVGLARVIRRNGKRITRVVAQATARHTTSLRLHGRLTNANGRPLGGAVVQVSSDSPGDTAGLVPAGLVRTDPGGRFTYVARANRNKVLRFRYPGSPRIRAATGDFTLQVRAASSIRARPRRLRNGQTVQLSGTVTTRPLPPAGKLIEVQAYFRGRFRTFSTTRADDNGRWRFPYRFGGTSGRVPYRLRALLPAEGGYAFMTGRSPVARVVVVGGS